MEHTLSQQNLDNDDKIDRVGAILSLKRALLGEVAPTLRAACINWNNETVHLYFFYDGAISEEDHESAECIATEVISDFPDYKLETDILRLDYPKPIPNIGELVYFRKEIINRFASPKYVLCEQTTEGNYTNQNSYRINILLAMIEALQGEVSPTLRAARISWTDEELNFFFYYDGAISDEDHVSANRVAYKTASNFPGKQINISILRWDYPKQIPQEEGSSIYLRREHSEDH